MTKAPLHIVFTDAGASLLRQALEDADRDDHVISSFEDFSLGPIDSSDFPLRLKWMENELGWVGWPSIARDSKKFWREALTRGPRKIAWLSRRSAMQYAGFLEWLSRMGDSPCEVVDLSDVRISRRNEDGSPRSPTLAITLGMLHPDTIGRHRLWDLAEPLQATTRERYRTLWQRLRSENAPLRVIEGDELVSAPISFFDTQLMSYVTNEWQKVAMVVGQTLAAEMDDEVLQVGDIVLAARIGALVESGRLEIQGKSALEMRKSLVRLPQ